MTNANKTTTFEAGKNLDVVVSQAVEGSIPVITIGAKGKTIHDHSEQFLMVIEIDDLITALQKASKFVS